MRGEGRGAYAPPALWVGGAGRAYYVLLIGKKKKGGGGKGIRGKRGNKEKREKWREKGGGRHVKKNYKTSSEIGI